MCILIIIIVFIHCKVLYICVIKQPYNFGQIRPIIEQSCLFLFLPVLLSADNSCVQFDICCAVKKNCVTLFSITAYSSDLLIIEVENKGNQDKFLISVIVAPIYNFEEFRMGTHLNQLGLMMDPKGRRERSLCSNIIKNENKRYHYLNFAEDVEIVESVIDFKHYFTVTVNYLNSIREEKYVSLMYLRELAGSLKDHEKAVFLQVFQYRITEKRNG